MKKRIIFFALPIGLGSLLYVQKTITKDERMQWWREARFGMFIHWGLYAIPAGEWNGKPVKDSPLKTLSLIPSRQ